MNGLAIIFIVFVICLAMNVPIGYSLSLSGMVYIMITGNLAMTSFASVMINAVDSFPLMAIPYFILAGALMEVGGISRQIVSFAMSLVGRVRGGLAMVAVISCAFFAALSGSGIATTAAIGAIMIPEMKKAGYQPAFSGALIAASGCLGPIIPPSVPMVMFGAATDTSISAMLIGGLLPGILLAVLLCLYANFYARKKGIEATGSFSLRRCWHAFLSAIPALLVPIIILGVFTAVYLPRRKRPLSP
jgi:C4-dicarboxylate transporter DctM subunit